MVVRRESPKLPRQISLRNVRVNEELSEETTCFSASLYFDNKRVAVVKDRGDGGAIEFHPVSQSAHDVPVEQIADAYAKEHLSARHDYGITVEPNAEMLISSLLAQHQMRKFVQETLRDRLAWITPDGDFARSRKVDRVTKQSLAASPDRLKTDTGVAIFLNHVGIDKATALLYHCQDESSRHLRVDLSKLDLRTLALPHNDHLLTGVAQAQMPDALESLANKVSPSQCAAGETRDLPGGQVTRDPDGHEYLAEWLHNGERTAGHTTSSHEAAAAFVLLNPDAPKPGMAPGAPGDDEGPFPG